MKIRKAKLEDLKKIGELMNTEFSKPPFKERVSIKDVVRSLGFYFKIGKIFIATSENKIIGVVVFKIEQYWEGKVVIIEDLAIDEKFQQAGIGKTLMKFVENYAKKRKIKFIFFKTHKKSKAVRFYKKMRYKQDKNAISMSKKLK